MIASLLLMASAAPQIIVARDPMDEVVQIGPDTLQKHTLNLVAYRCSLNNIEGTKTYAIEFFRTGGQAFLTGNDRIPLSRTPATVEFTKNESPYPLEFPTRIFASSGQTMMSYDNPGYVPMGFNALHTFQSEVSFLVNAGEPKDIRLVLRGKCKIEEQIQSPTEIKAVSK